MVRILFVCHGNICRSVAAEYIFNDLIIEKGLKDNYVSNSAAATTDEIGSPIYEPMRKTLERHGISIGKHKARLINREDLEKFDYILIMDRENYEDIRYMFKNDENLSKVKYLKSFSKDQSTNQIADPWYTRDFEKAYQDIRESIIGLIERV